MTGVRNSGGKSQRMARGERGKDSLHEGRNVAGRARQAAGAVEHPLRERAERIRDRMGETYEHASEWAHDTYGRASTWAEDAYERGHDSVERARSRSARMTRGVRDYASENPMVVCMVGLAAGFLIGTLLPRTRRENKAFGEWSDDVREQGLRYAQDMTQRGRDYVEEALRGDEPSLSGHDAELEPEPRHKRH
ncbi:hypothetical protein [Microvirga flavescens]|uniref:hypothetical protein n=1 Tax=Microvirga flavescens TaxID=2249811 RepID=UPI001300180B|nr:hypothetical protein [Microvirga flavescens]